MSRNRGCICFRAEKYLVVGAIDFGTSYSGYAYSFKTSPTDIARNRWNAGSRGLISEKIPTCILFDKDENFQAFGFDAEDEFAEKCYEKEQDEFYFFKEYKMRLYDQMVVRKDERVKDLRGKELTLFKVVTETIKYLKQEMFNDIASRLDKLEHSDVLFVLTVPAIWTDSAKGFMRDAAEEAGIPSEQLLICLEPEAAAIFCRTVNCQSQMKLCPSDLNCFQPGSKYIVVDAGGGTADIVVQEVDENGGLKEIRPASGADWGGTTVDGEFLACMRNVHGQEAFDEFKSQQTQDFIDLMREFEVKKRSRSVQANSGKVVTLRVPMSLRKLSKANADKIKSFEEIEDLESMTIEEDVIRLDHQRFHNFFQTSEENIKAHVIELLENEELSEIPTVVLVGGYAESKLLQNFMKSSFREKNVVIPNQPGLAVLKGAVVFGHDPSIIAERVCRFTYGIECLLPYDDKQHKGANQCADDDGNIFTEKCFNIHCKVGENVKTGVFQQEASYIPIHLEQLSSQYSLYACPRANPVFVTESDCIKIGEMVVDRKGMTGSLSEREMLVALCFGGTEITIKATKKQTGEILTSSVKYDW